MLKYVSSCVLALTLLLAHRPSALAQTGGTRLPWTSTFDSPGLTDWDGFVTDTGATVVASGCVAGGCLRSPLVAGSTSNTYADFYFGDHAQNRGAKVEELWVRLHSKFDAGISWPNRTQKIVLLNLTDSTGARRYQVMMDVSPQGLYFVELSDIDNWRFSGVSQNIGTPVAVRLGQWDKLKLYVRLNTPGVANGVVRLWVNDQMKIENTALNIRAGTSLGMNKMILSTLATQSSPSNGVQWHDSLTIAATDPDAGSNPSAPAAPTNLRIIR